LPIFSEDAGLYMAFVDSSITGSCKQNNITPFGVSASDRTSLNHRGDSPGNEKTGWRYPLGGTLHDALTTLEI
tara:strand:+ start:379 stop:597 length:219 start_codon:yes stop_codon:yes gene_type:complete